MPVSLIPTPTSGRGPQPPPPPLRAIRAAADAATSSCRISDDRPAATAVAPTPFAASSGPAVDATAAEAKRWVARRTAVLGGEVAAATARGVPGAGAAVVAAVSPRRRSVGVTTSANLSSLEHATPPAPAASSMAADIRAAVIWVTATSTCTAATGSQSLLLSPPPPPPWLRPETRPAALSHGSTSSAARLTSAMGTSPPPRRPTMPAPCRPPPHASRTSATPSRCQRQGNDRRHGRRGAAVRRHCTRRVVHTPRQRSHFHCSDTGGSRAGRRREHTAADGCHRRRGAGGENGEGGSGRVKG